MGFQAKKCDRVFKAKVRVGPDAGEVVIETQPGVIPQDMEDELSMYLATILGDIIDAWPGWKEIYRIRDNGKKPCAGEKPSASVKEFGKHLTLAKPLMEPSPRKTLMPTGCLRPIFRCGELDVFGVGFGVGFCAKARLFMPLSALIILTNSGHY